MRWLTVTHTHRWHGRHHTGGAGPVYQERFKNFPVQSDEHFLGVARYIERNTLRAKLCDLGKAEAWRWGSLRLRKGGKLMKEEEASGQALSDWPVERPRNWVQRVNRAESERELGVLRECVNRGRPHGETAWVERVVKKLCLQGTVRRRAGRGEPADFSEVRAGQQAGVLRNPPLAPHFVIRGKNHAEN